MENILPQVIPTLIYFIGVSAQLLRYVLIISVLMSWFAGPTRTKFGMYIEYITRALTRPFRKIRLGAFDFSIIIAYILIDFLALYITNLLASLV